MSERLDVRRMLLRRGWTEDQHGVLRKGGAVVGSTAAGDAFLTGPGRGRHDEFTADFPSDTPAQVIPAATEHIGHLIQQAEAALTEAAA
ncbi:hypothetical protein [Streptomyces sp. NBRC 109706]|uniref:hypothetical protein n=1 Tax=Streptomyces sp. NBRC 109706 TaxID=1550035 RepID=UPI00078371AC|nr:hypothetical protein [Streptomyces sp. NBRC 109706]